MECPKCRAHNDDAAVCCSLCYETFKAKPKPKEGGASGALAGFACVASTVEGFLITGPMVIGDNGIHFFIKEIQRQEDGRAGTMLGDQMGGLVGGLVGAAINAAVDKSTEADVHRPSKLIYKNSNQVLAACEKILRDAPDIPSCKEFHTIEKKDLKSISFGFLGGMTLKTQYLEMEVVGIDPVEKASAYLKLKGYPMA